MFLRFLAVELLPRPNFPACPPWKSVSLRSPLFRRAEGPPLCGMLHGALCLFPVHLIYSIAGSRSRGLMDIRAPVRCSPTRPYLLCCSEFQPSALGTLSGGSRAADAPHQRMFLTRASLGSGATSSSGSTLHTSRPNSRIGYFPEKPWLLRGDGPRIQDLGTRYADCCWVVVFCSISQQSQGIRVHNSFCFV